MSSEPPQCQCVEALNISQEYRPAEGASAPMIKTGYPWCICLELESSSTEVPEPPGPLTEFQLSTELNSVSNNFKSESLWPFKTNYTLRSNLLRMTELHTNAKWDRVMTFCRKKKIKVNFLLKSLSFCFSSGHYSILHFGVVMTACDPTIGPQLFIKLVLKWILRLKTVNLRSSRLHEFLDYTFTGNPHKCNSLTSVCCFSTF